MGLLSERPRLVRVPELHLRTAAAKLRTMMVTATNDPRIVGAALVAAAAALAAEMARSI
jgi:hypothetical protein